MLTILLALITITTAKLASNIIARFIGNVLDYAGDTREDFMRDFAEADAAFVASELAAGLNIYRATGGGSLKRQQPTAKSRKQGTFRTHSEGGL